MDWLVAQQDVDGGWRSATYGTMRGGAGCTALAIYALTQTPEPIRADAAPAIGLGLRYLLSNLDGAGFVRAPDGSSDYPIYATALTLAAIRRSGANDWRAEREAMRAFLLNSQQEGGWPLTGGYGLRDDVATVSTTRFALEALRASGGVEETASKAALEFLARCQNTYGDGGFFFTPQNDHPLNKAGWRDAKATHSYGSATADGALALLDGGVSEHDARFQAAIAWLLRRDQIDVAPGFVGEETQTASAELGLRFYYDAALAGVIHRTPEGDWAERRESLTGTLLRQQAADGSWRNPVAAMREDDPLVATPFAIIAASALLDGAAEPTGD